MAFTSKFTSRRGGDNPFWISFSDLMAGLLFVFILVFSLTMFTLQRERESRENIKARIIAMLLEEFQKAYEYPVEINAETGTVTVSEGVLFGFNRAELTPAGKAFLKDFIPKYCAVLFKVPEIREEIAAVIVEGHTDEIGSYQFNMGLSLRRALNVVEYIFSPEVVPNFAYQVALQQKLSANGRSKIDLKATPEFSRRVEFKFRLKEIDVLDKDSGIRAAREPKPKA